jgi:hypothetical protein
MDPSGSLSVRRCEPLVGSASAATPLDLDDVWFSARTSTFAARSDREPSTSAAAEDASRGTRRGPLSSLRTTGPRLGKSWRGSGGVNAEDEDVTSLMELFPTA